MTNSSAIGNEVAGKTLPAQSPPAHSPRPHTPANDERRKQRRFACRGFAEVLVSDGSLLFRGAVHDLSQTGCYISSRAQLNLARGTEVEVLLILDCDQLLFPARVMIVRPGKGAGFEFLAVDAPTEKRLARWIKNLTAQSAVPDGLTTAGGEHPAGDMS